MEYIFKISTKIHLVLSFLLLLSCHNPNFKSAQDKQFRHTDYIHDEMLSDEYFRKDSIRRLYLDTKDQIDEEEMTMKSFFVEHGEDSLLVIPGFVIVNLFYSRLEGYRYQCFSYRQFKETFLTNAQHRRKLEEWSMYRKKDESILNDYEKLPFEDFFAKYTYIENGDTFALSNDVTICYCLDNYGYDCYYSNEDPIPVVKRPINGYPETPNNLP